MTTSLVTARPRDTTARTVRLLVEHGLSSVPVVDATRQVVGIVSEVDLLHACLQHDPGRTDPVEETSAPPVRDDVRVHEVMTRNVLTLEPTTDVWDAARLLVEHGVKAAPVVVAGCAVGIVARRDLLRLLVAGACGPEPAGEALTGGPSTLVAAVRTTRS